MMLESPPARGAWIEISPRGMPNSKSNSRPPHGGRGLKYFSRPPYDLIPSVAPRTGGVD